MNKNFDRTVHATSRDRRFEVVRYDLSEKWWLEITDGIRTPLRTIAEAVDMALDLESDGGTIHLGRAGGTSFDAKVRQARTERRA